MWVGVHHLYVDNSHSQTIHEQRSVLLNLRCIVGKAKLWPLCLSCMEPAGFRFAVYKCLQTVVGGTIYCYEINRTEHSQQRRLPSSPSAHKRVKIKY